MDGEDRFSQRIDINDTENIPVKTLHFVGLMLFRGDGVPQNYAEAAKWFSRAAGREFKRRKLSEQERTSIFMQSLLNLSTPNYECPVDLDSYGNQCIASSQYYLGFMYLHGLGVKQDYGESVKWLGKAAEFGHEEAEYLLGLAADRASGRTSKRPRNGSGRLPSRAMLTRRTPLAMPAAADRVSGRIMKRPRSGTGNPLSRALPQRRKALVICTTMAKALSRIRARLRSGT